MEIKQVKCGSVRDGFEALTSLCEKEAHKLCSQLDIKAGTTAEVSFWTNGSNNFSELIGIGKFTADKDKNITFVLDYSQTTL